MSVARKAIRKKIKMSAEVSALLRARGPGDVSSSETSDKLRALSEAIPCDELGAAIDDPAQTTPEIAQIWGMVLSGESPDDVRAGLIDKADVVTVIESDAASSARQGDLTDIPGAGRPLPVKDDIDSTEDAVTSASFAISSANLSAPTTHWSAPKAGVSTIGTAREAMRQMGAGWSNGEIGHVHPEFSGEGVNVIIVDVGLTEKYLRSIHPTVQFMGGMVDRNLSRFDPGQYWNIDGNPATWHGNMIARNILRMAPKAKIYDAPLLPSRVTEVGAFTEDAEDLFDGIENAILTGPYADEPWIIVNAWAVADSIQEFDLGLPSIKRFTDGPAHPFNALVSRLAKKFDIVFAAGNFGEFAPDNTAGIYDRGFNRSIKGANALSGVLTVGSVNTGGAWIGSASHGSGPKALGSTPGRNQKPDIVAPAWFAENNDPAQQCTGTSTSCALAAGVVAGLRTVHRDKTPAQIFDMLRDNAKQTGAKGWNGRTGYGCIQYQA